MADETITMTAADLAAAIDKAVKAAIPTAVNDAIKATKTEVGKGTKAAQAQLETLLSTMKPKALKKAMKRLGLEKTPEGKTPEQLTADAAAAALAAVKKAPTEDDLKNKRPDMYAKRVQTDLEARLALLETENASVKLQAKEARKSSVIDRALTDYPWASVDSRDMVRDFYSSKVKWNDEETELLIGDKEFSKFIAVEIPAKYENLLQPLGKGGSGSAKGQGKPGAIDVDALTNFNSTPAEKAEASRFLATQMGG